MQACYTFIKLISIYESKKRLSNSSATLISMHYLNGIFLINLRVSHSWVSLPAAILDSAASPLHATNGFSLIPTSDYE